MNKICYVFFFCYSCLIHPVAHAQTNVFPSSGNAGIGTTSPGAKLSFNNVNDGSNQSSGITWHNPSPLDYGIFRTAGPWSSPDYQQLKLAFETGIVLYPGGLYGRSYVDVQGGGLRVTSGYVGIGLTGIYGSAGLHVKARTTSPWSVISEAQTNRGIIGINHSGNAGIIAVSYLDQTSGFKPLELWTSNVPRLAIAIDGNVGIGTTNPNQKLTVNGVIYGKEVKVDINVPGPDYVFEKDYNLPSLEEIKNYIDQNKHLPEVPSAKEMEANGIKVSEMNMILLKKVEELTLYVIELKNENKNIREEFAEKIDALKAMIPDQKKSQ